MYTTRVLASPIELYQSNGIRLTNKIIQQKPLIEVLSSTDFNVLSSLKQNIYLQFPEQKYLQYDCGKLQILNKLLSDLKQTKHRCLIYTQMTKMLDILELFLKSHSYTYLRLDGTTKLIEKQILTERFNTDEKIFVFILSTRTGRIGVNLTGADTVIFYDSDWNPTIHAQIKDRCHRIGQTKDVHIYRLINRNTIEENIFKKSNQKSLLGDSMIDENSFDINPFKKNNIQQLFDQSSIIQRNEYQEQLNFNHLTLTDDDLTVRQFEEVLTSVEDELDRQAIEELNREINNELNEDEIDNLNEYQQQRMNEIEEELNTLDQQVLLFLFLSQNENIFSYF
jgi:E1A-binding protein p400